MPFTWVVGLIGQPPVEEVDRLTTRVVDFDPVRVVAVLILNRAGVAGHHFGDEQRPRGVEVDRKQRDEQPEREKRLSRTGPGRRPRSSYFDLHLPLLTARRQDIGNTMGLDMGNSFRFISRPFPGHDMEGSVSGWATAAVCEVGFEGPTRHVAVVSVVPVE